MRKVGLYNSEMISLQGCNFWTGGLAYNTERDRLIVMRECTKVYSSTKDLIVL